MGHHLFHRFLKKNYFDFSWIFSPFSISFFLSFLFFFSFFSFLFFFFSLFSSLDLLALDLNLRGDVAKSSSSSEYSSSDGTLPPNLDIKVGLIADFLSGISSLISLFLGLGGLLDGFLTIRFVEVI